MARGRPHHRRARAKNKAKRRAEALDPLFPTKTIAALRAAGDDYDHVLGVGADGSCDDLKPLLAQAARAIAAVEAQLRQALQDGWRPEDPTMDGDGR